MVLLYSSSSRIFGVGNERDRLLLLNIINKFSIFNFLKLINTLERKYNFNLNINKIVETVYEFFYIDVRSIFKNLQNKNLINFYFVNFYLNFYFFFLLKYILDFINPEYILFEFSVKKQTYLEKKKRIYSVLNPFRNVKTNRNPLYSFKIVSPRKRDLNQEKRNLFIIGEVYDYYRGSITPFYKSKFSWFASTGLKTDAE